MPKVSRDDWLRGAMAALGTEGVGDVKVESLARRLGVTKGSFYHHFDDRRTLLSAVLAHWAEQDTERIIALIAADPAAASPVAALTRLVEITIGNRSELDGVEAAIREWAAVDAEAEAVSRAVDDRRLAYVTDLFEAAGVDPTDAANRAHLLYRVVIGEYTWRRHGGPPVHLGTVVRMVEALARP